MARLFDFTQWQLIEGPDVPSASDPHYEIIEAGDGSFVVNIYGGEVTAAAVTQFGSRDEAAMWVNNQRRKRAPK